MRRISVVIAIGSALCLTAPAIHAISFGRVENATVLGQPLDFAAVIAVSAADDPLDSECLAAEVFAGDNKLPAPLVHVRLEPGVDGRLTSVRVSTTVRIDEPVVTVNLMIGCPVKLSRRFVAFVDPPVIALPNVASEAASGTTASSSEPRPDAPPTTASARTPEAAASAVPRPPVTARQPRRLPPANVVATTGARPRNGPARAAGTPASAAAASASGADRTALPPSRLVLDSAASSGSAKPISAAASAILAAELESYAKELAVERQRMKALEESVERMRRENESTRVSLARVQAQLHDADAARGPSNGFYGIFAAVVAVLLAVIAGLLWWQAALKRRAAWWADSKGPDALPNSDGLTSGATVEPAFIAATARARSRDEDEVTVASVTPVNSSPLPMRDAPPPASRSASPHAPDSAQAPASASAQAPAFAFASGSGSGYGSASAQRLALSHFDTQPMPPGTFVRPLDRDFDDADKPGRELSVEELIDLEQQAEFFVVLGQDDAAIDLLMGLVRSSGGQSPMPYLKLLEIYRRLGHQDAYDRIRERFNQRFNGVAPSIDVDPASGFDLTDYPDMLGRIQAAWNQPQQVLTMIERLIPRAPGDVETLFDLEAFAELLFLTRIARDLSDIESGLHGVDFLLPLDADPLITGPATMSLHAPYEPHKAMMDLTLDLDLDPMN